MQVNMGEEKEWLYTQLESMGIEYWKSEVDYILIRSPFYVKECARLLKEKNIIVRSEEFFGAQDCLRITVADHEKNKSFVDVLHSLLVEVPVINAHE